MAYEKRTLVDDETVVDKELLDHMQDGILANEAAISAMQGKSISILFIGNSLTQDTVSYLPYVLKQRSPDLNFRICYWGVGGHNLKKYYDNFFVPDVTVGGGSSCVCRIAENTTTWTALSVTMKTLLSRYKFDIVVLQEYYTDRAATNYPTSSTPEDFNNCARYISENHSEGIIFGTLFNAAEHSDNAELFERRYNIVKTGVQMHLRESCASFILPAGIAMYRAGLDTTLKLLGDQGYLQADYTHAQEGLPSLMEAEVAAGKIYELLGLPYGFIGSPIRMTADLASKLTIGPNGTAIPGTEEENKIAQTMVERALKECRRMEIDALNYWDET